MNRDELFQKVAEHWADVKRRTPTRDTKANDLQSGERTTRDEWILKHVPAVKTAVSCFGRAWPWLREDMIDDMEAEALLRLTQQADALAAKGPIDPKRNTAYACAVARHACIDYLTAYRNIEKKLVQLKLSEFSTFCSDFTVFNGYETEYRDRGSCIPMSEYMGEEELAALEAFINREPKTAWQRSKLKRRALHALRTLGIRVDDRITKLYRPKRVKGCGDLSNEGE